MEVIQSNRPGKIVILNPDCVSLQSYQVRIIKSEFNK